MNLVRQISISGILAVGVTFVLLTGGVDLSLGSLVALTGVVAASFAHPGEVSLAVPVLMGALTGAGCGALNGLVITRGRVAPFIATLGMMTAARGLALVISGGRPVSNLRRDFTVIGSGDVLGIPIPVVALLAVALASAVFLRNFRLGRYIYAVGGKWGRCPGVGCPGCRRENVRLYRVRSPRRDCWNVSLPLALPRVSRTRASGMNSTP